MYVPSFPEAFHVRHSQLVISSDPSHKMNEGAATQLMCSSCNFLCNELPDFKALKELSLPRWQANKIQSSEFKVLAQLEVEK